MTSLLISDIRPILDFASPIWNTGFIRDQKLLESVQRRWTKQVSGLSQLSYADRLSRLNIFSIKGRLLRNDLILCYKIFHNLSTIKHVDLFTMSPHPGTRGHRFKILPRHTNIEARKRFFSHRVISHWNSLPSDVVESTSLALFKSKLSVTLQDVLFSPWSHSKKNFPPHLCI